jgi:hypothetical protein
MGRQAMREQGLDVEEADVQQLARRIAQVHRGYLTLSAP